MRKTPLLAIFLAAACGQVGVEESNEAANRAAGRAPAGPAPAPVQTASLTGLYEGNGQLCITGQDGRARFGLVTRTSAGRPGCSGAGTAARSGETLRLAMDGDSRCVIQARIEGGQVTFPAALPPGCAYYCAPGAGAGGAAFTKTGGTRADALRARDLVDDPLCS